MNLTFQPRETPAMTQLTAWLRPTLTARRKTLFTLAMTLAASAAFAQAPKMDEGALLRATEEVVAEYRVYATCFAINSAALKLAQDQWRQEVKDAIDVLKPMKPTPAFMTKFAAATQFSRLLDPDMKFSAVIDLCHRNEDKLHNFLALSYTRLSAAMASTRDGARQ
ncbi:hypothetical protein [Methylibium rhizosphaerae]|uniref:hypothetical protein n=1 Tax=Methylibium rhizosphaerae TaxID=2570323 RepID=UPI00112E68F1|nr:hypothetical protein [Methylibium rhizosphaerae]